jgi:hypothetical protein
LTVTVDGPPHYLNTVDSPGVVRVAGIATDDVLYFSDFWVWQMERPLRKLATNIFELSVLIVCVRPKVCLSLEKVRTVFLARQNVSYTF